MLKTDLKSIATAALAEVHPARAVQSALQEITQKKSESEYYLIAIGKAAWPMARAAWRLLPKQIVAGFVLTKYQHAGGPLADFQIWEAAHPVPDNNSRLATSALLKFIQQIPAQGSVIFLLSGGGSALLEKPLPGLQLAEIRQITEKLLRQAAPIQQINTLRKHLSAVKGGRLAQLIAPAQIHALILSDVVGNRLDSIASGPVSPDPSTCAQAAEIVQKYQLQLSTAAAQALQIETPQQISNVTTQVIGSVETICQVAAEIAKNLGYQTQIVSTTVQGSQADLLAEIVSTYHQVRNSSLEKPRAYIWGGETVLRVQGNGLGGRNQELALRLTPYLAEDPNAAFMALGTDGTDGPTDAAGGIIDGSSYQKLQDAGCDLQKILQANDSYHALQKIGDLLKTGPTGTNLNDLNILLLK
ncbi:MAG: DUF4147 domain-containing protein [Candidatus Cloacimonadales bacterium]